MHCLASIIKFLEQRGAVNERTALPSEQIYQGIQHEQDKQSVYQTLHQYCVKTTVLKRVKHIGAETYKYFYEPGTPLPSKVADDMLFSAQRLAERSAERSAERAEREEVVTHPEPAKVVQMPKPHPNTVTHHVAAEAPKPEPEQIRQAPSPIPYMDPAPVDHYGMVIKDLEATMAALQGRIDKIGIAIDTLRAVREMLAA